MRKVKLSPDHRQCTALSATPCCLCRSIFRTLRGLKLDHPRQLAVMHSLVRFANVAGGGHFTTIDLYAPALHALGRTEAEYSLASFRYDVSKPRAKRLVERIPHSCRYRLVGRGYSICVAFLKLFEKIYAPLTADCWRRSAEIDSWQSKSAANSIAFISASAITWIRCCKRSASQSSRPL